MNKRIDIFREAVTAADKRILAMNGASVIDEKNIMSYDIVLCSQQYPPMIASMEPKFIKLAPKYQIGFQFESKHFADMMQNANKTTPTSGTPPIKEFLSKIKPVIDNWLAKYGKDGVGFASMEPRKTAIYVKVLKHIGYDLTPISTGSLASFGMPETIYVFKQRKPKINVFNSDFTESIESDEYPTYPEKYVKEYKSKYKIDLNTDPSAKNNFAIQLASENGHAEIVKLLLADSRVDPSVDDDYAIRWASKNGHMEVVKLLLTDKRVDGNWAIIWASENGNTEVVKLLLADKRVDPSVEDNLVIQLAIENEHPEVVKLLLNDKRVVTADSFSISKLLELTEDAEIKKVLLLWAKDNRK